MTCPDASGKPDRAEGLTLRICPGTRCRSVRAARCPAVGDAEPGHTEVARQAIAVLSRVIYVCVGVRVTPQRSAEEPRQDLLDRVGVDRGRLVVVRGWLGVDYHQPGA